MKCIFGLGNPGEKYQKTRHNVGFMVIESILEELGDIQKVQKFQSVGGEVSYQGEKCFFLMPQTYMNLSGKSVQQWLHFYKMSPDTDLLIVHDDKDLLFGKQRMRNNGSSGGNNGIKSILQELGTEEFTRLKIGVGHEQQKIDTAAFVLQSFSEEEQDQLPDLIISAKEKIYDWVESP
jgi:PTH1 family peptidyl-tRNA hydrolase